MNPKSLTIVLFFLSFTVMLAACAEETSNEDGPGNNGSEKSNKEESTGEEAAEITNDGLVYALHPVSISAEQTVYEFSITNESGEDKELSFTTSQRYEYELNQDNELIKRFSDDMAFMQVLEDINLPPGESLSYELKLPELEPGEYTLTAYSVAKNLSGNQVTVTFVIEA